MSNTWRFGRFEVCATRRQLLIDGSVVPLGSRAFDVLAHLVGNRTRLVTKTELLDTVWAGLVVEEGNVGVQVSALRKALGNDAIATVPGFGYRFAAEVDTPIDGAPPEAPPAPAHAVSNAGALAGSSIPAALDTLVGRQDDVDELSALMRINRLVCILGPGGIGKTRLAQEVARRLVDDLPDGVHWVDLAAVSHGGTVATAVANASNLHVGGDGTDTLARVVEHLRRRHMLLVLDNCEHLAPGVAEFVRAALSHAPQLRVLITSQEALHVSGGVNYGLAPLRCPTPTDSIAHARGTGSIQLLERRAMAADRRFQLTDGNIGLAIDLVNHLDGMPLAIEMAAARVPALGLELLTARLHERFEWLHHAEHTTVARHRTLLATLAWSNALLNDLERAVLRRLAVFVGSFRLDAARVLMGEEEEFAVLDAIGALVDKSLVQVDSLDPPRYRLLETVRLFGTAQARQRGELEEARFRHGCAMTMLAREIEARFWEVSDAALLQAYARDYDDLQWAFERACERQDSACAATTACALMRLDVFRGLTASRKARAERLHPLLSLADVETATWVWTAITTHGLIALDAVSRIEAAAHAVAAARQLPDPQRLHLALGFHACESARIHDFDVADRMVAEANGLVRASWPPRRLMWHAALTASVASYRGDAAGYRSGTREEIALAERAGAERSAAWARLKLADAALMAGDTEEAIALGRAVAAQLRALDQPANLGLALTNLCAAMLLDDDLAEARTVAVEAMAPMWGNGWAYLLLDSVALIAAMAGRPVEAARLTGFVDRWYERHVDTRQPNEATLRDRTLSLLAHALSPASTQSNRAIGTQMSDRDAEAMARQVLGMGADPP